MKQYLDLVRHVLEQGVKKPQRAMLESTGTRPHVYSVFGYQMRFDLAQGFPLLTTKRLRFDWIAHELIWFLRGDTNIAYLKRHGVTIWDEWADEQGELGPVYGKQWRRWEGPHGETVDQIARLVQDIRRVRDNPGDSAARRLILSAWNPVDAPKVKVPFCHTLAQFMVVHDRLSCQLYQRSADIFLGVPWNIACYALLTHLLAHVSGLRVAEFIHTFGDAHVYENHREQLEVQLRREPLTLPRLEIDTGLTSLDDVRLEHLRLPGYRSHPALKGEVAV
jgi:thymidylate synthase